jgi:hypothetical protein
MASLSIGKGDLLLRRKALAITLLLSMQAFAAPAVKLGILSIDRLHVIVSVYDFKLGKGLVNASFLSPSYVASSWATTVDTRL